MTNEMKIFDQIQIGRRFKTSGGIVYKKTSPVRAKLIIDRKGNTVTNGKETSNFKNTRMKMEVLN